MQTTRIDIRIEKGAEELFSDDFYTFCSGTWIEDENDMVVIKCYPTDPDRFLMYLHGSHLAISQITVLKEEEKDYAQLVRKNFTPVRVGPVTILPPWRKTRRKGMTITIEPGMAFGTGRHESTKLMLKMMTSMDFKGRRVLDIGSGSAILAIYASLLGASFVAAIDNDPVAARAAKKSCSMNETNEVLVACAHLGDLRGEFDIVLANLDFKTFDAHGKEVTERLKPGGYLIISGIERQFRGPLLSLFRAFPLLKTRRMKDWYGFVFQIDKRSGKTVK
jgi:ribosomal protein L11 methyltransferase